MSAEIHFPAERLAELAGLGAQFHAEGKLPGRFVPEVFEHTWRTFLDAGVADIFVHEQDHHITGMLGAIIYPDANDGALVATEMFWYVAPEARGTGLRLLRDFETWAQRRGAARIIMAHLHELMPEALTKLYLRRGYRPVETHYLKEVN